MKISNNTNIHYQPSIDGLRAIAVLLVLGFHAFPTQIPGGYVGVDIFFVISGYLISTIILKDLSLGNFSLKEFYFRRVRRLLPALLLIFIGAYAVGWFVLTPHEFENLNKQITAGSFFVANFILWKQSGYFDEATELKPFQHLWSLAIEEQFYLIWPLLLIAVVRYQKNPIWIMCLIFGFSFVANIWITQTNLIGAFYAPWTRFWELSLGGILACYQLNYSKQIITSHFYILSINFYKKITESHSVLVFSIGLFLIAIASLGFTKNSHFPSYLALLPTFGALFILLAITQPRTNSLLSNQLLVKVGLISYPLYLWHWVLLSYARILYGEGLPNLYRIAIVTLSFLLAWFTYRFVERPFRFGSHLIMKAQLLIVLTIAMGILAFFTKEFDGFPQRFDKAPLTIRFQVAHCDEKFTDTELRPCVFGNLNAQEQILVFGDSMAGQLTAALNDVYGKDYKITFLHHKDCFSSKLEGRDVSKKCELVWQEISKFRGSELALLVHAQWWHIDSFEEFSKLISNLSGGLGLQAKKYIISGATPWVDLNCHIAKYYLPFRRQQCLEEPKWILTNEKFSQFTRKLNLPNIAFIYPFEVICPNSQCMIIDSAISNFNDTHHLSHDGALKVMPSVKAIFP